LTLTVSKDAFLKEANPNIHDEAYLWDKIIFRDRTPLIDETLR